MDRAGCPPTERLGRLLEGELPAGERDEVSAHLDDCPRCQERIEQLLADDSVLTWRRTSTLRAAPGPPADFLDSVRNLITVLTPDGMAESVPAPRPDPGPCPDRIGGYEILGLLGRGGMALVYKARQPGLGRVVALKLLNPRSHHDPDATRFLREAEAVARMHHPNIVQVYEVGEDGSRPFLALEYVPGGTLAECLKGTPTDPREAAEVLEQVARAVHHAHERGIIHRDLKPSNILLEVGRGDTGPATPKVSDFGLARAVTEDQSLTLPDVVVGTPAYLSPEAVRDPGHPAPSGDVYALGVVLYEMLTGRPPLVGPTALDTLRLIDSVDPVPPSRLQPHLPRDLDTICMACLRKDPHRRYPSARAMADDLRRFLDGRPILARRVGRLETARLWCRRNPVVAALGAALAVSVLAGLGAALVLLDKANRSAADAAASAARAGENETLARAAARSADDNARLANDRAYAADLQFAHQMWMNRQHRVLTDLLDGQRPERTDGTDRRGFEWHFLRASTRHPHRSVPLPGQGWDLAAAPDGRYFAVALADRVVELRDGDGKPVRTLTGPGGKMIRVAVSADGTRVAGGSDDGTAAVWDAASGRLIRTLTGHRGLVTGLTFLPDGRTLITVGVDGTVRVSDLDDPADEPRVISRPGVRFHCAAVTSDGRRLAVGGSDGAIRLWATDTREEFPPLRGHTGDVLAVRFAPDSVLLASGSRDRTARLWDAVAGKPVRGLGAHLDAVFAVAFSPDGRSVASASLDRSVQVVDGETGLASLTLLGHGDYAVGVAYGSDGKTLASTGWDQTLRLWDLTAGRPHHLWRGHSKPVGAAVFAPTGDGLATGSLDGNVRLWEPTTGTERRTLGGHTGGVFGLAYHPNGQRLATSAGDKQVRVWDVKTGAAVHTLAGHTERVNDLRFGPGGRLLAGAGDGGAVYLWDAGGDWAFRTLANLPAPVTCVRFDSTGTTVAAGCRDGTVAILDVASGVRRHQLTGHAGGVHALDFSPDGRRLAVASADRSVRIWDGETGNLTHTLRGHVRGVTSVCFSPDGGRLFSGSQDRTVRVWHAASGKPLVTLVEPDDVTAVAIHPDGGMLASAGTTGLVSLRRAHPVPESAPDR